MIILLSQYFDNFIIIIMIIIIQLTVLNIVRKK